MLKRLLYKYQDYDTLHQFAHPAICERDLLLTCGKQLHDHIISVRHILPTIFGLIIFSNCSDGVAHFVCSHYTKRSVHYCLPTLCISLLLFFPTFRFLFHLGVSPKEILKIIIIQLSTLYFLVRINLDIYLINDIHIRTSSLHLCDKTDL